MDVLLTGANGRVGTAVEDHLGDAYDWTFLDREHSAERPVHVADVADYDAIRPAFEGQDAVVHLAGDPNVGAAWESVLESNVVGTHNVLRAAREAGVESVVFASTNHVVAGWETEYGAQLLSGAFLIDHETPVNPDSYYAVSKSFGEALGRYHVAREGPPERFYALRIGGLLEAEYDHPFGYVEKARDRGEDVPERGTEAYERSVRRTRAMWLSRRDGAHLVDCCLRDRSVSAGVFYGISDNRDRWFDLEHARATLGYDPVDDAGEHSPPDV